MRELRRLRRGLPDRHAAGKNRHHAGPARTQPHNHLRLLRRRLQLQGRDEGQRSGAHGAVERRQGQRRPLVCQGPLCLGLRDPQGPHHQTHDPPGHQRPMAGGELGRSGQLRCSRVQAHPGQTRQGLDRRHHLVALHQRRNLPGPKAGARRVRQQQRGHLRTRLPFTHGVRPGPDLWHLGRHADLQVGRTGRRHRGHRRQPDRRTPGVCIAHEKAPA